MKGVLKNLSIKHSILLLTLLPSLFIATALTIYLVISRQSDAQNELLLQVNSAINYLAKSSELPLFSGDVHSLERLADATISNSDMISVTFYDSSGKDLLTIGEGFEKYEVQSVNSLYSEERKSLWIFQIPVSNIEIDVDDYNENIGPITNVYNPKSYLGWVQIIADKRPLVAKKRTILFAGVSVGALIFGLLGFIATKFSNSISLPLVGLTETVKELKSGNLNSRVLVKSTGELKDLVDGVNQLADEVKTSNEELKDKVKEATQKLTSTLIELEARNSELEETGKELVNASNVKDEFLASVSHELRTPLTSIIGYSSLLKKSHLQDEQKNQINTISQASKILLQLIDNILDFSKLESESLDLENIPFNLNELLSDVSSLHMPAAAVKGINLQFSIDINLYKDFVGDPLRIKQILNNLIQNSIKFTEKGFVKVSVSKLNNPFGIFFVIQDSGIGMSKENRTKLFQPFNQLDSSISRRFGGTGLGLVICKKLVSQFGGEIKVKSQKGHGTEVTFSIFNIYPKEFKTNLEIATNDEKLNHVKHDSLSGKLILIAEDNSFIQDLLKGIFEQEGAKVIAVDNGLSALEEVKNLKPDLAVLDYQMPILDGILACKEIRKVYTSQELPLVLLTADVINISITSVKEVGINEVIHKPINNEGLINCVRSLTNVRNFSKVRKVLDVVSDDLLKDELNRLKKIIIKNYEFGEFIVLKKLIHELCGVSGSSSKYKKLWELAQKIDTGITDRNYDYIETYMAKLRKIKIE